MSSVVVMKRVAYGLATRQRCQSGGRRRLTAPMLCTNAPTIGSGWGLHGMFFYGRRRSEEAHV
eukprot:5433603-Prymnesium_polylepis.1